MRAKGGKRPERLTGGRDPSNPGVGRTLNVSGFILFWAASAVLALAFKAEWRRRAVFWPTLVPSRVWWSRDTHPGQFWVLLIVQLLAAGVCFVIPVGAALHI